MTGTAIMRAPATACALAPVSRIKAAAARESAPYALMSAVKTPASL